ncbi:MAG: 3-hydroxybutyryl-CoA dehydrogenase [Deltaproteobacteria bacterium]|nr:3-hydroxybutyryl-CoA dehydrogenase [Deltaproteobacteria bacterium]
MSRSIKNIAVIGAGQMGSGIAQVFAQAGYRVILQDAAQPQLDKAAANIRASLQKLCAKGKLTEAAAQAAGHALSTTTVIADCAAAECGVEAVTEQLAVKHEVLKALDAVLAPTAIIATNTSSIGIGQLGAVTHRPSQVIGMHFMNPVPLMPCVEVIRATATSEQTFQTIQQLIERLGKAMVVSKDRPGFIVNRILMPMINEAAYALQELLASREDIDAAMKLSCNFPMGPLALADFIGLDTVVGILEVMREGLGDAKFTPCPLLKDYMAQGRLGRKSGKGFYDYA